MGKENLNSLEQAAFDRSQDYYGGRQDIMNKTKLSHGTIDNLKKGVGVSRKTKAIVVNYLLDEGYLVFDDQTIRCFMAQEGVKHIFIGHNPIYSMVKLNNSLDKEMIPKGVKSAITKFAYDNPQLFDGVKPEPV